MIDLTGRNLLTGFDLEPEEARGLVDLAVKLKSHGHSGAAPLAGRVAALFFFNPSLRTRLSCESAMTLLGGAAVALQPGRDTWNLEFEDGAVMDGATQEHVRELAPVASRLADLIGVRCSELMPAGTGRPPAASYAELREDAVLRHIARHAEVPVVNLESNLFHPLQGLADMATIHERLKGEARGRKYVLTWAWHPRSLPVATPHSQALAACDLGMDVTVLRPEGWSLDPAVTGDLAERAERSGGSLRESADRDEAFEGAHVVCAKSWSGPDWFGRFEAEAEAKLPLRADWIVDEESMARTDDAFFMHCLPVRRNVIVTDGVLDSERSAVVDEAENRLWTAAAVFRSVLGR